MQLKPALSKMDEPDYFDLYMKGRQVTPKDAAGFEHDLKKDNLDLSCRIKLLGHYNHRKGAQNAENALRHLLWFIDHTPDCDGLLSTSISIVARNLSHEHFSVAVARWATQVKKHPADVAVYANAGQFASWKDIELGKQLLERAQELDPHNSKWVNHLCRICYFAFEDSAETTKDNYAIETVKHGLRELSLVDEPSHLTLQRVGECALYLGQLELANQCADLIKPRSMRLRAWINALYGLVALRTGNVKLAVEHFHKIGKTLQDQLMMCQLAAELCRAGEAEEVIESVKQNTNVKKKTRERWINEIRTGVIPDFRNG